MEEITEEQQLNIVREKTDNPAWIMTIVAVMAALWALVLMPAPDGKAIVGAIALASGSAAVILAMVRRSFFAFAFGAAALTTAAFVYFIWLLPLLAR